MINQQLKNFFKIFFIFCAVIALISLGYFFGRPMVSQIKSNSLIQNDNVALINLLKENNLQGAVVQKVDQTNNSTVSLLKSDGTVKEILNWTDAGTHNCGYAYLSDCSDRASIRTRFMNSSVPVDVHYSSNLLSYIDYTAKHFTDSPISSQVDLSQYFENSVHLQGYSDNFSPDGKFVFHEPVMRSTFSYDVTRKYYMTLDRVVKNDYVNVTAIPNILNVGMAWTPDSRYLIYEYQDPIDPADRNFNKNADTKISVYDTLTNTQTELTDSFPVATIVGALGNNKFIGVKGDGTYVFSISGGVVSESKLFSPETKLIGLVYQVQ